MLLELKTHLPLKPEFIRRPMGRKAHGTFIHSPWQGSTRGRLLTQNLPCLLKSDIHSFLRGNFCKVEGTLYS